MMYHSLMHIRNAVRMCGRKCERCRILRGRPAMCPAWRVAQSEDAVDKARLIVRLMKRTINGNQNECPIQRPGTEEVAHPYSPF